MSEFLQAYAVWIIAGILLVLLVLGTRNRGSGEVDNGLSHPGSTAAPTRTSTGGRVEAGRSDENTPTKRGSDGCC
jgi:hypothetical protein